MKKLFAILLAMGLMTSLTACGGSDDVADDVADDTSVSEEAGDDVLAVMESAAADLTDALVSTIWIDEELSVYGFSDNGDIVMQTTAGDQYACTFYVDYDETALYMVIEGDDFGTLEYTIDTESMTNGVIGMYDADGNYTTWVPMEDGAATAESGDAASMTTAAEEIYTALISYYWTDEDQALYCFNDDATLTMEGPDGSVYEGYYEVSASETDVYLTIEVPDVITINYVMTDLADEGTIYMTDMDAGTETYLTIAG